MLVLTRKQKESVYIGDEVVVTILATKGKSVRIGIEAPDNVSILRAELPNDWREAKDSQPEHGFEPSPFFTH